MSHTLHKHYYHLVWSTKERYPLILPEYKERIFEYLGGTLKTLGCIPIQIGGMSDHVHILAIISPKYAVSDIVKDVKVGTNKWIAKSFSKINGFAWQEGFGSFTVSKSQIKSVIKCIADQEKHHKKKTFKEELIEFLDLHEVDYDKRYLWN